MGDTWWPPVKAFTSGIWFMFKFQLSIASCFSWTGRWLYVLRFSSFRLISKLKFISWVWNIFNSFFKFQLRVRPPLYFWDIPAEWNTSTNLNRPSWLVFVWGVPSPVLSCHPRRYDSLQNCGLPNKLFNVDIDVEILSRYDFEVFFVLFLDIEVNF